MTTGDGGGEKRCGHSALAVTQVRVIKQLLRFDYGGEWWYEIPFCLGIELRCGIRKRLDRSP